MADDRPLDDLPAALAALRAELEDMKSTTAARESQSPTGTFGWTLATIPQPGTVFLYGQVLQQAAYPRLHAWVAANAPGGFTSTPTTVTLPDARGKVLRAVAATGETAGQTVGSDTRTLTTANLPAHDHNVSLSQHEGHGHAIFGDGDHGGHFDASQVLVPAGSTYGVAPWNSAGSTRGFHGHSTSVEGQGKPHTVSEQTIGSGTAVDLRQAGLAVNYLVWT